MHPPVTSLVDGNTPQSLRDASRPPFTSPPHRSLTSIVVVVQIRVLPPLHVSFHTIPHLVLAPTRNHNIYPVTVYFAVVNSFSHFSLLAFDGSALFPHPYNPTPPRLTLITFVVLLNSIPPHFPLSISLFTPVSIFTYAHCSVPLAHPHTRRISLSILDFTTDFLTPLTLLPHPSSTRHLPLKRVWRNERDLFFSHCLFPFLHVFCPSYFFWLRLGSVSFSFSLSHSI